MRRAFVVSAVLLLGCATDQAGLRRGATCESFVEEDARVRERLDALLADAPGDQLVRESSRLNAERRACARHVVAGLRDRRESEGNEAVQRELDALAATYPPAEVDALLVEVLGEDARSLQPMLIEARVKAQRAATTKPLEDRDDAERKKLVVPMPESMGPAPQVPDTMCDEPTGCAQLRCVLGQPAPCAAPFCPSPSTGLGAGSSRTGEAPSQAVLDKLGQNEGPARRCLDEAAKLELQRRAEQVAEVLSLLPPATSPARTEARLQLETLQRQRWPEVEAAVVAHQPSRAATLALPFRVLPGVRARVEALFTAARAHHLDEAKRLAATPDAAWVHEALLARLEGRAPPALGGTGDWAPLRWLCSEEKPELPDLPAGLRAVLTVRCGAAKKDEPKRDDAMRTFELESSLQALRVEATLALECAGRASSTTFRVQDPGIEGFPADGLKRELERRFEAARRSCAQEHRLAATRSCADLRSLTPAQVLARFVGHARFTRAWEPCFVEWLQAAEGVPPPPLD